MLGAAGDACTGHPFAQAAFGEEILFEAFELLVEQVVGLMDQADENIGHGFRRTGFDELAEVLLGKIRLAPEFADVVCFFGIFVPLGVAVLAEVVAIIAEQFLQAAPGNIGELDFEFLGSAGYLAALGDVLVATACRLHHLIVGAGAHADEAVAKAHGGIIDDLGFLVAVELFVAAMRRDKALLMSRL